MCARVFPPPCYRMLQPSRLQPNQDQNKMAHFDIDIFNFPLDRPQCGGSRLRDSTTHSSLTVTTIGTGHTADGWPAVRKDDTGHQPYRQEIHLNRHRYHLCQVRHACHAGPLFGCLDAPTTVNVSPHRGNPRLVGWWCTRWTMVGWLPWLDVNDSVGGRRGLIGHRWSWEPPCPPLSHPTPSPSFHSLVPTG